MQGAWSSYVSKHLIPRLNGFELLMAAYSMAHLKLDILLRETGYNPSGHERFNIFLTNSLEKYDEETGTVFASWLSGEASAANYIKKDTPVMVVIGNPPYKGVSSNNNPWILDLIEDYKYVDGEHFNEKKHWLNDDYVKFIRYAQHFIERNGEGVIAFINAHGFLDNPTFRGMRWKLLNLFDCIYAIDLHGNVRKGLKGGKGSKDENVFNINQGVSINFFVKNNKKKKNKLADVFYYSLLGKKKQKFIFLDENSLSSIKFEQSTPTSPYYFFVPGGNPHQEEYESGFSVADLFSVQSMGVTSARDHFVVDVNKDALLRKMREFSDLSIEDSEIRKKYFSNKKEGKYLPGDTRGWKLTEARKAVSKLDDLDSYIVPIDYRAFDVRNIFYLPEMVDWGREEVMHNMLHPNYALCCVRIGRNADAHNYFVTKRITDKGITSTLDNANVFPLYLYDEQDGQAIRTPNFNQEAIEEISDEIGIEFSLNDTSDEKKMGPLDLFDYIYATLYSKQYREKFKDLLMIDFPKIPYPNSKKSFWQLVKLGRALREVHLFESPLLKKLITKYPVDGDNVINRKIEAKDWDYYNLSASLGRVWINENQYFDQIPASIWEYKLGGYKPAQKWLKDRSGHELSYEDIFHYQKIIVALSKTDELISEIDSILFD